MYWQEVSYDCEISTIYSIRADKTCMCFSLGWMEIRQILAKLIWNFDLEMTESDLDWHRDSRMYTLWSKPHLHVRAKLAEQESIMLP